jgi:hypothetical protein
LLGVIISVAGFLTMSVAGFLTMVGGAAELIRRHHT